MRMLVSARIQRILRSLSISSVVGRGTSLFSMPFSCTRPYFFVASRSGSDSTRHGRSKALASAAPAQRQHRGGKGEEARRPPAVPERRPAEEQDVGDPDADRREDGQDDRQLLHCLTSRK